ncbi:MAG TPA: MBL fold metallo-hydrolase [Solirubrobacteraceae bacterium]|jgi:glyoxylase-like metal-dependent hydrolase (beta-lactamase superfamily II)|nr:MBL fold metallo-hydrolase [Solirubrobacteraceae bacterium]
MDEQSPAGSEAERLGRRGVLRLRAPNPGPLTLSGTNSWLVGRDPAWVIDPGPAIAEHVEALLAAIEQRGGLGGVALTHDHADHVGALAALRERHPAPLAAGRGDAEVALEDGARFGPLQAVRTPGHSTDHFAFLVARVCFTGDAVLGEGSVFIAPDPGALAGYLSALERLRARELDVLCPGHGPAVWDARERISQYIEHRLDRERRLLDALREGRRTRIELLDAAWSEVPEQLRGAAAVTLQAHLGKLAEEGRLPPGVEPSGG